MSMRILIQQAIKDGRLTVVPLYVPGDEVKRRILASRSVFDVLDPDQWGSGNEARRRAMLRGQFDHFIGGGLISVAENPYSKWDKAFIARVDPVKDEIWDIRVIDPKPAIRVLGAFAETDVFIALEWEYRTKLGGPESREWRSFVGRAKAKWRSLFGTYKPHTGANVSDYVSENFYAV